MAKSVLEKMYRGEFAPHEYVGIGDDELICMSSRVDRLTEAFTSKLSDSLKAEFEALEKEKAAWGSGRGCSPMRTDSAAACACRLRLCTAVSFILTARPHSCIFRVQRV